MSRISRRRFVTAAAAGVLTAPAALYSRQSRRAAPVSAQQIVDRIKQQVGVAWRDQTVDTFKAGDPSTVVTGIVTTAMATMDVLRQTVQARANLVITSEPTFYSRSDSPSPGARRGGPPAGPDPILTAKNDFVKNNGLVIWRFSDHWRQRKPDPLSIGLTDALGWSKFRAADDPARITIPAVTLDQLGADIKKKLNARGGIRIVGDPRLRVQRVGLLPGTSAIQAALGLLPEVDAVIAGEVREWESVEYARDKITAGERKTLILLGRVVSENPGMNVCAQWVKTIVPEVATTWVPVGDPYWSPI